MDASAVNVPSDTILLLVKDVHVRTIIFINIIITFCEYFIDNFLKIQLVIALTTMIVDVIHVMVSVSVRMVIRVEDVMFVKMVTMVIHYQKMGVR